VEAGAARLRLLAGLASMPISCFPPGSRRTLRRKPIVAIGVDRRGVGCDNNPSPSPAPPDTRDYQRGRLLRRVELFRILNHRKSEPLRLRFRALLTEDHTKRLE
jgi:hypothetical protein